MQSSGQERDDHAESNKGNNVHIARMGDDRKLKTEILGVMKKKQKRKTSQRMGGRHRGLGRRHTAETVPFGPE